METSKKYYNLTIVNNDKSKIDHDAIFNASFAQELLDKPEEYQMIVQKFSMDTKSIPVTVMEIKNPQTPKTDDWETIHNIYIVDSNNNIASSNVKFNSSTLPNKPPIPVKQEGSLSYYNNKDPYFFVYNYTYLLKKINDGIEEAYNQLFPSIGPSNNFSPHFILNPVTQLITLYAPMSLFQYDNPNRATIYFSLSLSKYVGEGFLGPFIEKGVVPGIDEITFTIDIINNGHNTLIFPKGSSSDDNTIAIEQEHKAISSFTSINAIIIRSSSISFKKEFFPQIQILVYYIILM